MRRVVMCFVIGLSLFVANTSCTKETHDIVDDVLNPTPPPPPPPPDTLAVPSYDAWALTLPVEE